jgi:hypothetical protein
MFLLVFSYNASQEGEWQKLCLGKYRMLSGRRLNHLYLLRNGTPTRRTNVKVEVEENQYLPEQFLKP